MLCIDSAREDENLWSCLSCMAPLVGTYYIALPETYTFVTMSDNLWSTRPAVLVTAFDTVESLRCFFNHCFGVLVTFTSTEVYISDKRPKRNWKVHRSL